MRTKSFWIWSAVFFLIGAAVTWSLTTRPKSPPLTTEALAVARDRWVKAGVSDYDMVVEVAGREPARHQVEVRDGKVVRMISNGSEAPERTWEYWSVEGMFRVLDEELANARAPQAAFGVSDPSQVYLDAAFDEASGIPRRYLRQVSGRRLTVEWEIASFAPR